MSRVSKRTITRFAPSPTGQLHLGHAASAIRAHDFARGAGGSFLLRIEDIDGTRSREQHVAGIIEDLAWLGLTWDGPVVRQSARLALYESALDRLKAMNLLYPCFCTRADIAASASAPHGPGGAIYPGTCRAIDASARMAEPHCWRLDMGRALLKLPLPSGEGRGPSQSDGKGEGDARALAYNSPSPSRRVAAPSLSRWERDVTWHDSLAGNVIASPAPQGDVVLARKDAPASYHLAVTVDDAAQNVTDVVRGIDLFDSTHVHRLLQHLLGLPTPTYHHHPLLTDATGQRLAKRDDAPTLADLRTGGADGPALAAMLRDGRLPIGFGTASA